MSSSSLGGKSDLRMPQTLILENVAPATRLLEKRRQMFEVQETLDCQKEEFQRREEAFRRREEGLRLKDLELQESLIRFNKFLQENESKRARAEKRAKEEAHNRKLKEEEIKDLKETYEEAVRKKERLQQKRDQNMKYQYFLEMVQETHSEEYGEIVELLNRYKTLNNANADLIAGQIQNEKKTELKRVDFAEYKKSAQNKLLNLNNQFARYQKDLEKAESRAVNAADKWENAVRGFSQETLEVGKILMAVENLLQRCTKKHGQILKHTEASGVHLDTLEKIKDKSLHAKGVKAVDSLEVLKNYMTDFRDIVKEYKR
eukprot:g897.t1